MKTLHQSNNESFLVSDELEGRLSHLVHSDLPKDMMCTITLSEEPTKFSILGWDTDPTDWYSTHVSVVVEIGRTLIHHFFNRREPLGVEIFGHDYEVIRTDAWLDGGIWKARLYLD